MRSTAGRRGRRQARARAAQVFGCIKNTVVVGLGVAMGDTVAPAQLAGYAVSVFGFALYTRAKMLEAAGAAPRAPRRAHKKAH